MLLTGQIRDEGPCVMRRRHNSPTYQPLWKKVRETKQYLLLVLLPLLVGIILLAFMWHITSNQIERYGAMTTSFFQAEAASMFREVETVGTYLVNDSVFADCVVAQTPEEFDQQALIADMQKYKRENSYIEEIYVCNINQGRVYSSEGYWTYRPYLVLIKSLSMETILSEDIDTGWQLNSDEDTIPYYIFRVPTTDAEQDVYVIITMRLYPLLQFMNTIDVQGCAIYNDSGVMSPLILNETEQDWQSDASVSRLLGTKVKTFSSSESAYTYVTAVALNQYNAPLKFLLIIFSIAIVATVIVAVVVLMAAASKERRRFASIMEYLPPEAKNNPSLEELFAGIEQSLRQYRRDKQKYQEEIRSSNVRQILKRSQSHIFHQETYEAAGIPTSGVVYCVVSLYVDDYSDMFFDEADELQNIEIARVIFHAAFSEIAGERAQAFGTGLGRIYSVLLCLPIQENPLKTALAITREVVDFLTENYGINPHAAVSRIVDTLNAISMAYHETERLNEFIQAVGIDMEIVTADNLTDSSEDSFDGSYLKQLQILANTLNLEKYDLVPELVANILEKYVIELHTHMHIAHSRVAAIAGLLAEAVLASNLPKEKKICLSRQLSDAQTAAEVNGAVKGIFPTLASETNAEDKEDPLSRACDYIKENNSETSMSITSISDAVGISPQHLTRLFRKKFGVTASDYLHSHRITMSKDLLMHTSASVSVIARQVGYSSANTFIYNFRLREGITPTEFRELRTPQANS